MKELKVLVLVVLLIVAIFLVILSGIAGYNRYVYNGPCVEKVLDQHASTCDNAQHRLLFVPGYRVCRCPPYERP